MIDLSLLTNPVPGNDPCGPDLDADGDADYLNFFASIDTVLPASFFEVRDGEGNVRRFDPGIHDLGAKLAIAEAFAVRTRDLRLIILIAKLSILNRDANGFSVCVEAIAELCEQHWGEVHPRGEANDFSYRQMAIEALNVMPTVIMPLQFLPLADHRRLGTVTYRTWLMAKGEITPRADDLVMELSAIEQVFDNFDIDRLKGEASSYAKLALSLQRICRVWEAKAPDASGLNLDRLQQVVDGLASLLASFVKRRDPTDLGAPVEASADEADGVVSHDVGGLSITSVEAAAAVLAGVEAYFARMEPSSPVLLLVRQAQHLLGKSFAEAIHMLVPNYAEAASIHVGRGWVFDLSIDRMAVLPSTEAAAAGPQVATGAEISVGSRADALALLDRVAAFFRSAEPSSPVPFLADRARELAQRDFLSLLVDVLPSGSLRTPDNQT